MKWVTRVWSRLRARPHAPPKADVRRRINGLTARERQVFLMLLEGKTQREIAQKLGIQPTTAGFHTQSLYRKLDIHNRSQLFIRYALSSQDQEQTSSDDGEN